MRHALAVFALTLLLAQSLSAQTESKPPTNAGAQSGASSQPADASKVSEIQRLNTQVVQLFGQGKYTEALPLAQNSLELSEQTFDDKHPSIVKALVNLAAIYAELDKNDEAEKHYKRALSIYEQAGKPDDPSTGDILIRMAFLRFKKRNYSDAESLFQRAVAVKEKAYGADAMQVAEPVYLLAEFYRARGNQKAGALYERALTIWSTSAQANKQRISDALDHYYCFLVNNGQREKLGEVSKRFSVRDKKAESDASATAESGEILNGKVISKPAPSYPTEAREARLSGSVIVKIVVDETGRVTEAKPMCAHPVLMQSAAEAARRARFSPTLLNGQPVKVSGWITYNFVIQ